MLPYRRAAMSLALLQCLGAGLAPTARGESQVTLPFPRNFGNFPATAYSVEGEAIGKTALDLIVLPDGVVRLAMSTAIDSGWRNTAEARLIPVEGGLRLLDQRSEVFTQAGQSRGVMKIDHVRAQAACIPPGSTWDSAEHVALPEQDRVVNVPLHLLFQTLVQGEAEHVEFQFFLCGGGARIVDFQARVEERGAGQREEHYVQVRYRPDVGRVVSWIADAFLPNLSFWFDPRDHGAYLAHRMPLYQEGPEVMIVKDGILPGALGHFP